MAVSEAKIRANRKWNEKAYDRISVTVKKGQRAVIADHARDQGETVNGFIKRAIRETMERDNVSKS